MRENMKEKLQPEERELSILITRSYLMGSFKEILVIRIPIFKKRWRRTSSSDLSSNSKLVANLKGSPSICLISMIKEMPKEGIKLHCRIIRLCQRAILREIQAISRPILKNKYRKINSSDPNNSSRLVGNFKGNPNIYLISMTKGMVKGDRRPPCQRMI